MKTAYPDQLDYEGVTRYIPGGTRTRNLPLRRGTRYPLRHRDTAVVAQLGERQTEDLKVPGSIPGDGTQALAWPSGLRRRT